MVGREEKSEEAVGSDDKVASSRASENDDGSYVGRTFSDDAIDVGETGAEARSRESGN